MRNKFARTISSETLLSYKLLNCSKSYIETAFPKRTMSNKHFFLFRCIQLLLEFLKDLINESIPLAHLFLS